MSASILITGAGRGLGFALVQAALAAGFRVVAGERQRSPSLDRLVSQHPEQLFRVALDVSSAESVRSASERVRAELRSLDVLVNNAAILPPAVQGTLDTLDVERSLEVLDVNALGPLRVTQAFLPLLERGAQKLVVNISSEAGSIGDCWRSDNFPYCMSKAALNMQTALLANHLKPRGFRVFAVHPGWLRTDMGGSRADLHPNDAASALLSLIERRVEDAPLFVDSGGNALAF
jgi:NAD(P)-dependent dehydrogenase (short-subunit alcohol dehydrogenase family)